MQNTKVTFFDSIHSSLGNTGHVKKHPKCPSGLAEKNVDFHTDKAFSISEFLLLHQTLWQCIISILSNSQRLGLCLTFLEHSCTSEDQFWIQTNNEHCSTCQWHLSRTFREIDYRGSLRQSNEVRLAFLDNICNDFSENGSNYPPEALLSCLFEEGAADE